MRNAAITAVLLAAIGGITFLFLAPADVPHRQASGAPDPDSDPGPEVPPPVRALAEAEQHFFRGDYEEAAAAYRRRVEEWPRDGVAWARLAFATHELGDFEAALAYHERAATFVENRATSLFRRGCALAQLGRDDEAFASLEQAIEAGYRDRAWAEQEPDLDSLRGHERFARLLDRMAPPPAGRGPLASWAGYWIIRDPGSAKILGHVSVRGLQGGNVFTERWSVDPASPGQGLTYLDPADGAWKLVRVDRNGEVYQLEGVFHRGALHLTGERRQYGGRVAPLRGVIEPQERDRVRYLLEVSEDGGATWTSLSNQLLCRDEPSWIGRGGRP